jgi:hypothetical protein
MKLKGLKIVGYFSFETKNVYETKEQLNAAVERYKSICSDIKQKSIDLLNWVKKGFQDVLKMKPSFKRWATILTYKAMIKDLKFNEYHEFRTLV